MSVFLNKMVWDPLKLELQVVANYNVSAGNWTLVLGKSSQGL